MSPRGRIAVTAAGAIALAALAYGAWRVAEGPAVGAYAVERGELLQTVVASGHVESPRRVEIGSSVVGSVASIPVGEGQQVRAGELLIALDDSEARANVAQARSALAQAEAKLGQIRATGLPVAAEAMRQARANFDNAERALARSRDLFAKGFVGQAALDEAQRARDVAASQLKSAELQEQSQSPGGADERVARIALDQARASLAAAEARLAFMTIEAPAAGTLISRNVEAGSVVQPGKVLMLLSPAGATELVVQIDEKNLALLALGQHALASADAYPDQRFDAQVTYINPAVDPLRGSVEVKLAVPAPPAYLLQDMTVSVDVEVARVKDALTVPADAIRDGRWVLVARDGHARRQDVKIGARGTGRVEVTEGLREGDLVVPATAATIRDGASIRAQARRPTRRT